MEINPANATIATIVGVLLASEVSASASGRSVVVGAPSALIIGSGVAVPVSAGNAVADGATPDSAAAV
jgi:hypothetical protein